MAPCSSLRRTSTSLHTDIKKSARRPLVAHPENTAVTLNGRFRLQSGLRRPVQQHAYEFTPYLIACGLIGEPVPPVMTSGGPQKKNS
jgi:hypothetical protein